MRLWQQYFNLEKLWSDSRCTDFEWLFLLIILNEINEPLNSTQLSKIIVKELKEQLFKNFCNSKGFMRAQIQMWRQCQRAEHLPNKLHENKWKWVYSRSHPKDKRLLQGWISFYQHILNNNNRSILIVISCINRILLTPNREIQVIIS